ncbi:hypothetical protein [Streptomyces albidoflavus]|uniref:hypothetical protein n=1 Tax=Streptomyces albidoflavus TaxID=1886 RepID=UPI00101E5EB6|nr:hypothetical protein [Streptomyces albidoflavus]RZD77145.1 hypothetical protein C0Q63_31890 [Streptomyces albidoflavus]
MTEKTGRTAPRTAILAFPAGAYVGITQAADGPAADAALLGGGITLGILLAPVLFKGAAKATAASTRKSAK